MAADEDGLEILKRRYAGGELTRKQYLEMRRNLEGAGGEARPLSREAKAGANEIRNPARAKHPLSLFNKAIIATLFIFIAAVILAGSSQVPAGTATTSILITTASAQPASGLLIPQNYTMQFTRESAQCGPPTCSKGWVGTFTVPAGSPGMNLTGSFSSQNATAVAVLTPSQFEELKSTNESSAASDSVYYAYNRSEKVDVRLAPGTYYLAIFYPGNYTDKVTVTRQMTLGGYAAQAQKPTLTAPSISPSDSTISPGQQVTFISAWYGSYKDYDAALYSSGTLPCDGSGRQVQLMANLSSVRAVFSPITPASSAYYCVYIAGGYGTPSQETANSATSYIQVSQSSGTTTVRPTTTISGGGSGGAPYCGAGYVLGSDGYCYPKCGSSYCFDDAVCQDGQCVTMTTTVAPNSNNGDCPLGYTLEGCSSAVGRVGCGVQDCSCYKFDNETLEELWVGYFVSPDGMVWNCGVTCEQAGDEAAAWCNSTGIQ